MSKEAGAAVKKQRFGPKVTLAGRLLNASLAIIFIASAILQYNDGEKGWIWALIYSAAASLCILAEVRFQTMKTYVFRPLVIVFCMGCFIASWFSLAKDQGTNMDSDNGRDFLGLLLVSIAMLVVIALERWNIVGIPFSKLSTGNELENIPN